MLEKRTGPGIVKAADSQLGVDYSWGGGGCKGPSKGGFDCSGLTQYAVCKAQGKTIRKWRTVPDFLHARLTANASQLALLRPSTTRPWASTSPAPRQSPVTCCSGPRTATARTMSSTSASLSRRAPWSMPLILAPRSATSPSGLLAVASPSAPTLCASGKELLQMYDQCKKIYMNKL